MKIKSKIAVRDEVILLKEQIVNRQIILTVVSGFVGLITLLFSVFLYKSYRRKKNLNVLLELKIKERTWDLDVSRNELLTALREQDLMITSATDGAVETINTIKGLCLTGMRELTDPNARLNMERIKTISGRLDRYLKLA
ncbi:MAG TPA: hypothetical protein VK625_22140, partial [Flavitalea sp.]|nr:hypothetical protein [Flavitalea sp.]